MIRKKNLQGAEIFQQLIDIFGKFLQEQMQGHSHTPEHHR